MAEQEGYRWRRDDGSEIAATWLAVQDTNVTRPLAFNTRLRVLLDTTADLASTPYRLEYKKSSDSVYVPVLIAAPAVPAFQAQGTDFSGTGDVTTAWPAHQAGDIGLLLIESCGGEAANLSVPAGFVAVTGSPISVGATTTGTRLSVYWCRATSSAQASPTITDAGDHIYSVILTFRGCVAEGDPWDVAATGTKPVASTASTAPSVTTTVPNTLVLNILSRDIDSSGTQYSAQANASLGTFTKRSDRGTANGNGGGVVVFQGTKATPGATGVTTATVASTTETMLTMALRPQPVPILMSASPFIAPSGEATTAQLTPPASRTSADFTPGRMQDDENPADVVTVLANHYTAFEWCVIAQAPAANGDAYDFRVTANGTALSTYSVSPQLTIGGIAVAVTGVSATGSAGSLAATGGARAALTGASASGQAGNVGVSANAHVSVTGISATAAAGVIAAQAGARSALSGVAAVSAAGTVTAHGAARATLTGAQASAAAGDVLGSVRMAVALAGVSADAEPGTLAVTGDAHVAPSGVSANAHPGDVVAKGAALVTITGVHANGQPGEVTVITRLFVPVIGVAAQAQAGVPYILSDARVDLVGVAADALIGELAAITAMTVAVPGVTASGEAGHITVIGHAHAALTGVEAQTLLGVLIAIGEGQIAPTGRTITIEFETRTVSIDFELRTVTIH